MINYPYHLLPWKGPGRGSLQPLSCQVVRLLLQAGADKDKLTRSNGWTPLHCAAWNGRLDVVRVLLEAGARKNPLTEDGLSPLRLASDNGQEAIKALFLDFGVAR